MGITIELSVDIAKHKNVTETKTLLASLAEKYNSSENFFLHEIEGSNSIIERNDCIHTVIFENIFLEEERINIINYLRHICKYKFIKIDCIYDDTKSLQIIYKSKKYQQIGIDNPIAIIKDKQLIGNKIQGILEQYKAGIF